MAARAYGRPITPGPQCPKDAETKVVVSSSMRFHGQLRGKSRYCDEEAEEIVAQMIVDWEDLIDRDDVHGSMRTIALVVTYYTGQEITIKRKIHEAIGAAMFRAPFGLNPKGVTLYSRILARGVKTLMGEESEGVYIATGEYGSIERRSSYDPLSVYQQS